MTAVEQHEWTGRSTSKLLAAVAALVAAVTTVPAAVTVSTGMTALLAAASVVRAQETPPAAKPPVQEVLRDEAVRLAPLVQSPLGKAFLAAVPTLPAVPARRVVYYNRATRAALSATEAAARGAEALEGYEPRELDEHFYYYTKYGTPLAFVRALDLVGQAGLASVDGRRLLDFGFGSIGQLRLLASLGAEVTGVEVDELLEKLYAEAGDTGLIPHARAPEPGALGGKAGSGAPGGVAGAEASQGASGSGSPGRLRLLFGSFPSDSALVARVGSGYTLFISKNTLKRGYVHPEREVDPRFLVHLEVDDATYLRAVHALLVPGGYFMIYNLSPAPSKPDEPYKPWSDGRSPFARAAFEAAGFRVLAFDADDTETARRLGKALGWDADMNLATDLFGTYTLVQKR